ncbi:putative transposase [Gordonia amicalis NBRC 100051 = JCM 11271]|nr:putative transposase [Gordonia amicalis NBRC 100051 = JCM 11271]
MRDEGGAGYGQFGVLSRGELERFFYLDDEDRRLIAGRRRDSNRLGFALQLVTVRYLGMFLPDPLDVPGEVDYLAEQLEIADPSCVKSYTDREKTRFEHAWEIQRREGLVSYAQVEAELLTWIADQAWMTGDGPKALLAGAVDWLRKRNALLPGVTTLERLVTDGKQDADRRLWAQLASQMSGREAGQLLGLLDTQEGNRRRYVELERLRKGAFTPSSTGMKNALARVRDVNAVIPASVDIAAVPARRLIALAAHGLTGKTAHLRRLKSQRERLLALLCATVFTLRAKAIDDVLELFDLLMVTDLMAKAERQSKDEKLKRYPRVSRNAGKLAQAVRVLLEMSENEPGLSLELVWDLIENTVSKAELRAALAAIDELVPQADPECDSQRLEELANRYATVRAFLPAMMRNIDFGATADAAPVLKAVAALADLISPQRTGRGGLPARWLDARRVDHDLVGGGWQRLVYPPERPEQTVDRAAYTLCVLEQFHGHLKHRNIFAENSSKWRDPRAHLLSGMAWESARDSGMNVLGLPDNPRSMLGELGESLDATYRELAARLGADTPATVDEDGKLHVAALNAVPDPPSLVDLRRRTAAMIPRVDLPEMVLEVMSWYPEFGESFTHVAGTKARVADLGVSVAALLCAQAMNVGLTPVTSPGADARSAAPRRPALPTGGDDGRGEHGAGQRPSRGGVGPAVGRRLRRQRGRDAVRGTCPVDPRPTQPKVLRAETGQYLAEHAQRPGRWAQRDGCVGHAARLAQRHRRDPASTRGQQGSRRHHFRRRIIFRHCLRPAASAGPQVPAAAEALARPAVVAHRPGRRLRAPGQGRTRADRHRESLLSLGGHVPGGGVDEPW